MGSTETTEWTDQDEIAMLRWHLAHAMRHAKPCDCGPDTPPITEEEMK